VALTRNVIEKERAKLYQKVDSTFAAWSILSMTATEFIGPFILFLGIPFTRIFFEPVRVWAINTLAPQLAGNLHCF